MSLRGLKAAWKSLWLLMSKSPATTTKPAMPIQKQIF